MPYFVKFIDNNTLVLKQCFISSTKYITWLQDDSPTDNSPADNLPTDNSPNGQFGRGQFGRGQFAHGQFAHNYCFFVKIYEFKNLFTAEFSLAVKLKLQKLMVKK